MLSNNYSISIRAVTNGLIVAERGTGYSEPKDEAVHTDNLEALKDTIRRFLGKSENYGEPEINFLNAVIDLAPWAIQAKQKILIKQSEGKDTKPVEDQSDDIPF